MADYSLRLRPWTQGDAEFVCYIRNQPELMRWFRQNEPITYAYQYDFITRDIVEQFYQGQIVFSEDYRNLGVAAIRPTGEMCIAAPLEYHEAITKKLLENREYAFGEVFATNPALKIYLNCGFRVVKVHEKQYFKKGIGFVDTIDIRYERIYN